MAVPEYNVGSMYEVPFIEPGQEQPDQWVSFHVLGSQAFHLHIPGERKLIAGEFSWIRLNRPETTLIKPYQSSEKPFGLPLPTVQSVTQEGNVIYDVKTLPMYPRVTLDCKAEQVKDYAFGLNAATILPDRTHSQSCYFGLQPTYETPVPGLPQVVVDLWRRGGEREYYSRLFLVPQQPDTKYKVLFGVVD